MDMNTILTILGYVVAAVLAFITHVANKNKQVADVKEKLAVIIPELIDQAEAEYADISKSGGLKFEYVVNRAYQLLPAPARLIISKEEVAEGVQRIFNTMDEFADKQVNVLVERAKAYAKAKREEQENQIKD